MLRILPVLFFLILSGHSLLSQTLVTDQGQLDFGEVMDQESETLELTLSNTGNQTIRVTDLAFFDTFNSPAFTSNLNEFDLEAGASRVVSITFAPIHNVNHNTELFIVTENRGTIAVDLIGSCQYQNNYYDETFDLSYASLKNKLSEITGENYLELGYNSARDYLYMQIDNQKVNGQDADENTITCVYTGEVAAGYNNRQQLQGMGFNCEHSWPQSFGAGDSPMQSDVHHLFPSEQGANSARGNSPFNTVINPTWAVGGSQKANDFFEPRNEQKGPSARAILYFATRYKDNSSVNLNWVNISENTLRNWNAQYPPTEVEMLRNQDIFDLQNNRNPYIDYPQFADRITNFGTIVPTDNDPALIFTSEIIDFGMISDDEAEYYFAYAVYNDSDEDIVLSDFDLDNDNEIEISIDPNESYTLEPGEDLSIMVSVDGGDGSAFNRLTFKTDEEDFQDVEVPIYVNTTVGIEKVGTDFSDQVQVYPNPTQNTINLIIDEPNTGLIKFSIFDNQGKLMLKSNFKESNISVPISQFNNGLYWIHLEHNNKIAVKSFVIQK